MSLKALVYKGPGQLSFETVREPELQPGELLLKVDSVGICGSELEGYLGHSSIRKPPLIMGHEFSGTVQSVKGTDLPFMEGDRVVVNPLLHCGRCDRCLAGHTNVCRQRKFIGIHQSGAFAEYVSVPAHQAFPINKAVGASVATLAEPGAVCLHALNLFTKSPFVPMLIIGAGAIGILTLQIAKARGFGPIYITDSNRNRLEPALAVGAARAFTPEEMEKEGKDVQMNAGFPIVVDCVGITATRKLAMDVSEPGGTILLIGLGHDHSELPINQAIRNELTLFTSYSYSHMDFEQSLQLLVDGVIRTDGWCTSAPLSEGAHMFAGLVDKTISESKIFLIP